MPDGLKNTVIKFATLCIYINGWNKLLANAPQNSWSQNIHVLSAFFFSYVLSANPVSAGDPSSQKSVIVAVLAGQTGPALSLSNLRGGEAPRLWALGILISLIWAHKEKGSRKDRDDISVISILRFQITFTSFSQSGVCMRLICLAARSFFLF